MCPIQMTPQVTAAPDAPRTGTAVRRRVLVVDDHRDAARILGLLLDSLGHEVRTANDAKQAIDEFEQFEPELVLLDIGLPGTDGYTVARLLRAHPRGRALRLVALTGWGHDEDKRRSREAGFDHHLVKPVSAGTLRQLIDSMP